MTTDSASLPVDDVLRVTRLVSLHGHLFDEGRLDELDLLFTPDVEYYTSLLGGPVMRGIPEIVRATRDLGDGNPVAHVVTNIVVSPVDADAADVRSKGVGVMADGSVASVTYADRVVGTSDGWRLRHRTIHPRRRPLSPV